MWRMALGEIARVTNGGEDGKAGVAVSDDFVGVILVSLAPNDFKIMKVTQKNRPISGRYSYQNCKGAFLIANEYVYTL
jgi:hypothetical protein